MNIAILIGILLSNTTSVREGDFVLSVRPLAMLEGGPQVVQLAIKYIGEDAVTVRMNRLPNSNLTLESLSPGFSTFRMHSIDISGSLTFDVLFSKGTSRKECFYLHRLNQKYPSEGVPFLAKTQFSYWRSRHGKLEGDPSEAALRKKLLLTTTKSTPARLAEIESKLINRLDGTYCDEDWFEVSEWLKNTRIKVLCSVAIRMLDATRFEDREWFSFDYLINCTESITEANRFLLSALKKPGLASANVFVAWRHPKFGLPSKAEIESLLDAPNPWVRGLTAASFSEFLRKQQCNVAFAHVRAHLDPEPSREFVAVLARLDDANFQVREEASKKLAGMGEGTEAMILRALSKSPSHELELRLKRALRDIQALNPVPESFRTIRALERMTTPESKELLDIIAAGPAGLRSTLEAKKAIARLREIQSSTQKLQGKEKK